VIGKSDKERRVPLDTEVAGLIQTYLLAERPDIGTDSLFVVAKALIGAVYCSPTAGGIPVGPRPSGLSAGHPHSLRHLLGTASCLPCFSCQLGSWDPAQVNRVPTHPALLDYQTRDVCRARLILGEPVCQRNSLRAE
jgi:integrase